MNEYRVVTTGEIKSPREIVKMNPNVALPKVWTADICTSLGIEPVLISPKPDITDIQSVVCKGAVKDGLGNWVQKWSIVPKFTKYTIEADPEVEGSVDVVVTVAKQIASEKKAAAKALVPEVISMRQARLALLQSELLTTVSDAIEQGTDEAMKIEWEYATEVRRDWVSLITMATALGLNEEALDKLFILGNTL